MKKVFILGLVSLLVFGFNLAASANGDKEEEGFLSGLKENTVFKKEVILGGTWSQEKTKLEGKQSAGFEILKRFTDQYGDWGTGLIQVRLVHRDNSYMVMTEGNMKMEMTMAHVEEKDDWELELHDAYFKYSGRFKGKFNIRLGHFDVPFGLEENVDTHSTLVQLMPMRNVGFKKDWGLSIIGQFPKFDYDFALTRGSGVELVDKGENYLLSARIGTPADENFCMGLSGLYGEVIDDMGVMRGRKTMPNRWFGSATKPSDDIIKRLRIGVDSIYLYGPFTLKGEVSFGEDVNQDVLNTFAEVDYLFPGQRMEAITQFQYAYQDITAAGRKDDTFWVFGFNYKFSPYVTLQTTYRHDVSRLKDTEEDNFISAQLYCYW